MGPQSSAVCSVPQPSGSAPPPSAQPGQGWLCLQPPPWPRLWPPAAVPSVQPGLCLSGTRRGLLCCPSGSTSSLRGETAKELWAQVPPAGPGGWGGDGLSRLGTEVHVAGPRPTALTELLGQATRPLPTQLPHPVLSAPWAPSPQGAPASSLSLERPQGRWALSPHPTPVCVHTADTRTHRPGVTRSGEKLGLAAECKERRPEPLPVTTHPQARGPAACPLEAAS